MKPSLRKISVVLQASCVLETGVKIYATRVDATHSEAYKVLGGLNRTTAEQADTGDCRSELHAKVWEFMPSDMSCHPVLGKVTKPAVIGLKGLVSAFVEARFYKGIVSAWRTRDQYLPLRHLIGTVMSADRQKTNGADAGGEDADGGEDDERQGEARKERKVQSGAESPFKVLLTEWGTNEIWGERPTNEIKKQIKTRRAA